MNEPAAPRGRQWAVAALCAAGVLALSLPYLLRPILDWDFFWHLKSGEWILQNRALPAQDMFSYTAPAQATPWQHLILTSYWLAQITYGILYRIAGFDGIVALRFLLVAGLAWVTLRRAVGDITLLATLLSLSLFCILEIFPLDRPQVFSWVFFALLLSELEPVPGRERRVLPTALLMLVWANTHAGYVVGQLTLLVYVATEAGGRLVPALEPPEGRSYRRLCLVAVAGLAASLLNPNTYEVLFLLDTLGQYQRDVMEYQSVALFSRRYGTHAFLIYWIMMGGAALAWLARRRRSFTHIVLLGALAYVSAFHVRYVPFFLLGAVRLAGDYLPTRRLAIWRGVAALLLAIPAVGLARDELPHLSNLARREWVDPTVFPVRAADFIAAHGLSGNMYNHFDWGGYLIWRLGPDRRVYVDGRCLDPQICLQSVEVNLGARVGPRGPALWEEVFRRYDVRYALTAAVWPSGRPVPLSLELLRHPDWQLAFQDGNSLLFVRR